MDYTIYYKESFDNGDIPDCEHYDYFISGFDDCERTKVIFNKVNAKSKIWLNFPHFNLEIENTDNEHIYESTEVKEDDYFLGFFNTFNIAIGSQICIDITGFVRPHLVFLVTSLNRLGITKIDFIYSEPRHYKSAEETTFSGFIEEVRLIEGCTSYMNPETENDLLIISAGYDDKLIAKVAQDKSKITNKYYLIGFPSLQPDMYQESILKMHQAKESIGQRKDIFAPAFDPFVTAQCIHDIVEKNRWSNIYLSPLSTKPQTLGIILYYLWNYRSKSVNIIYPYSNLYFPKTAYGIKKTWRYTVELPSIEEM
ncbi:hypothetical protein [Sphingobacterium siyangense]|uniref:hypothetical protein n=1 Tax=Sphingobacterium siyangense TaxID=459529 RepID=UPI003DA2066D